MIFWNSIKTGQKSEVPWMDLLPGLWNDKTSDECWLMVLSTTRLMQNDLQTNNNFKTNLNHKLQIIVNIENKLISAYLQSNYLFNKHSNLWNELSELKMLKNIWDSFTSLFSGFFFLFLFHMNEKIAKKLKDRLIKQK
jgi:hypothetical protein